MIQTKRLLLRQWQPSDFPLFAELCADSEVMKYFPSTLSRAESDDCVARIQGLIEERGLGLWAVEVLGLSDFIGFVVCMCLRIICHVRPASRSAGV